MTATGFLLFALAIWACWLIEPTQKEAAEYLSWIMFVGCMLMIAGITRFLWINMP